ncbi:hypothetical protein [Geitlerinema sp. PCC 7407]|uniref:hypothetical protein n=1 Tax=Geitlerinema sp. PCC 7407 TaxID=1173025 RepID=UPI00029FEED8|nr:hypothetical protein [Geitlerinema sp. PCC 7407]AFY66800.1 hypothetical protein GEI7407_2325 [Geitlerinema sp. PCC 7407]
MNNCAETCVNGCILGDKCPHLEYAQAARKFLEETSVDRMIEISEARFLPKQPEDQGSQFEG